MARTFPNRDFLVPWTFRHRDVMAWGHFGTKIFQEMDVSAFVDLGTLQSDIDILAQTFWHESLCQNIHVPK
jgi:hypothetical protein